MQENSIADSTLTSTNKLIHCKGCSIEMHSQVLFDLVLYEKTVYIPQRKRMKKAFYLIYSVDNIHVGLYESCVYCTYKNVCIYVFSTACGGVFNGTAGTISSPSHSISDYHHNINCTYHIYVRDNRVINLK